jgi:CHAT domain-containing protein
MDLLGTRLVVLSACETGLGEIRNGEGVQGLRRAFIEAGARTVVMSLWKVPDRETMELMVHFHEMVQAGERCAAALHAAQKAIRKQHPHPGFWGAFVCLGDPGPVTG